jgi:hypothetical protein
VGLKNLSITGKKIIIIHLDISQKINNIYSREEAWNLIKECGSDTKSLPKIYYEVMKDGD